MELNIIEDNGRLKIEKSEIFGMTGDFNCDAKNVKMINVAGTECQGRLLPLLTVYWTGGIKRFFDRTSKGIPPDVLSHICDKAAENAPERFIIASSYNDYLKTDFINARQIKSVSVQTAMRGVTVGFRHGVGDLCGEVELFLHEDHDDGKMGVWDTGRHEHSRMGSRQLCSLMRQRKREWKPGLAEPAAVAVEPVETPMAGTQDQAAEETVPGEDGFRMRELSVYVLHAGWIDVKDSKLERIIKDDAVYVYFAALNGMKYLVREDSIRIRRWR